MKQNTEQLKKEFEKLKSELNNDNTFDEDGNGKGHYFGYRFQQHGQVWTIPDWGNIWNFFLPHLISSDEIKREVAEDILNKLADVGVAFNKSSSFEYNTGFEDGLLEMDLAVATVEVYIKKTYLTQSKEGGE